MAATQLVGTGVISILLNGVEKVQANLKDLETRFKGFSDASSKIGSGAFKYFAVGAGSIAGMLRVADPVRFDRFTTALAVLSLQVGRIFIPLLVQATAWIDRLSNYFENLSDKQRENILHWTKLALGGLLVVGVLGKLGGTIAPLIGMASSLTSVMSGLLGSGGVLAGTGLAAALGPVAAVLAVIAAIGVALVGIVAIGGQWDNFMKLIQEAWNKIKQVALAVWDAVKPIVGQIARFVMLIIKLGAAVQFAIWDGLVSGLQTLKPIWDSIAYVMKLIVDHVEEQVRQITQLIRLAKELAGIKPTSGVEELPAFTQAQSKYNTPENMKGKKQEFAPEFRMKAPEITGIANAFNRAQTSVQNDPKMRTDIERNKILTKMADNQEIQIELAKETPAARVG